MSYVLMWHTCTLTFKPYLNRRMLASKSLIFFSIAIFGINCGTMKSRVVSSSYRSSFIG